MSVSDQHNRFNWRFPRTSREVFGYDAEPLRKSFSFHSDRHSVGSRVVLILAVLFVIGCVMGLGK